MPTIAIHTAPDGLLAAVAPLGCASSVGTALVVDCDPAGLPLPGRRTLRHLAEEGPTAAELRPSGTGVACLPNGGIPAEQATEVLEALRSSWPHVVLRVPSEDAVPPHAFGIAVRPLLDGIAPARALPTLYQPLGLADGADDPTGHRLPPLPARVARSLLAGRSTSGRWIRAWSLVWEVA